jgi:hypothetical protein
MHGPVTTLAKVTPACWTLRSDSLQLQNDRSGSAATREDAMTTLAKSWRRE